MNEIESYCKAVFIGYLEQGTANREGGGLNQAVLFGDTPLLR